MPFEIRSGVRQECALSPTLFYSIIDWIRDRALQDYPGVQVGANAQVPDFAHVDDIVILSTSYRKMHSLLETVNRRATAMHMCIKASKSKAMSAFIPGEPHLAVLLTGEPLKDVEKFK